ncbi:unnamed protein product [Mesocestoides corti]|uniref:F-box domain-containing protein n=1 Tax=Mesocestoides corti TaxID=53468 RepID=A0A0R3UAI1_MESCO|nr:unnamed protein product [Mesocestoides corti]
MESGRSSPTWEGPPPVLNFPAIIPISEQDLANLPKVTFDQSLLRVAENGIEIPLCLAGPMLVLQAKHNEQVSSTPMRSFLEEIAGVETSSPGLAGRGSAIRKMSTWLLYQCETLDQCKNALKPTPPLVLFEIIVEIIRRLEPVPFYVTLRTCRVMEKVNFLNPNDPFDPTDAELCQETPAMFWSDVEGNANPTQIEYKKLCETQVQNTFITSTRLGVLNIVNCLFFKDLYLTRSYLMRNIVRFLIINLIALVRKYCFYLCSEFPLLMTPLYIIHEAQLKPFQIRSVLNNVAKAFGPLIFRLDVRWRNHIIRTHDLMDSDNLEREVAAMARILTESIMRNILCTNSDYAWMPGRPMSAIIYHTSSNCPDECICRFLPDYIGNDMLATEVT